jgi:hypothetical protein
LIDILVGIHSPQIEEKWKKYVLRVAIIATRRVAFASAFSMGAYYVKEMAKAHEILLHLDGKKHASAIIRIEK